MLWNNMLKFKTYLDIINKKIYIINSVLVPHPKVTFFKQSEIKFSQK